MLRQVMLRCQLFLRLRKAFSGACAWSSCRALFHAREAPLRPAVWFLPRLLPRGNLSQAFPFHGARSVFRRIPLFLCRARTSQPRAGVCPKRRLLPVMRNVPGAYPSPCFRAERSLPYTQNILRGAPFRLCAAFIRVWKSNRALDSVQSRVFFRHAKRPRSECAYAIKQYKRI